MQHRNAGYEYLGIPEGLSAVLYRTVQDIQRSLDGRETEPWAQLVGVSLSLCVLRFSCWHREHGAHDLRPEISCSEVFHAFSEQLMLDAFAADWGVGAHMLPVVAGTVAACGRLVVDRMNGAA